MFVCSFHNEANLRLHPFPGLMLKVGVLSGVMYIKHHQGVWGGSVEAEATLHCFGATVRHSTQRYLGSYCEQVSKGLRNQAGV